MSVEFWQMEDGRSLLVLQNFSTAQKSGNNYSRILRQIKPATRANEAAEKNCIEYETERTSEIMKERGKRKQEFIELRK